MKSITFTTKRENLILTNDDVILLRAGYSIEKDVDNTAIEICVERESLHLINEGGKNGIGRV